MLNPAGDGDAGVGLVSAARLEEKNLGLPSQHRRILVVELDKDVVGLDHEVVVGEQVVLAVYGSPVSHDDDETRVALSVF
jgi:hypothetical protein